MSGSELDEFYNAVELAVEHDRVDEPPRHPTATANSQEREWAKLLATASCWAQSGDSYFPVNSVVESVPAGAYRVGMSNQGPYIQKMPVNIDHLLTLPDSATESLLAEFTTFWTLKAAFDKRGFTFKRGMLMWGPPGSGKTSAIWQMTQRLIRDQEGVVIFVEDPQHVVWMINLFRRIEPHRPIITVYEDIDAIIRNHGDHGLLALLDGEFQTSNVVHVATTNYPHLLDRRFINRPSRFDTIMKIGMPSEAARMAYFKAKEPELDEPTLQRWVRCTEGYSVAHLREVCIATQCLMQPEAQVFERLGRMRTSNYNLDETGENLRDKVGFR